MKHAVTSGPLAYQVTLIYEALFLIMPVISFGWSRKSKWRPKNGFEFYLTPSLLEIILCIKNICKKISM